MVAPEVTRRPWERQPGESSKAFRAFAFYRDLGPTRSLVKVGAYLGETGARTGSPESIAHGLEEWSVRWRWVERARAYELHQDRRRLEAREQTQREMEERHLAAAGALLYAVIARARGAQRPPEAGGAVVPLDPNQIQSWTELARVFEAAVRIERLTRGLPPDVSKALSHVPAESVTRLVYDLVDLALRFIPEEQQQVALSAFENVCRRGA